MKKEIMDFVRFKVGQHLRINGIKITEKSIRTVMGDKELVKNFLREAIHAGL